VSPTVAREQIKKVADWLGGLGVRFIVVGGSAIELHYDAGTLDVDVLILVGDWQPVAEALLKSPLATPLEPDEGQLRGTQVRLGGIEPIDLEFLSAEPFSGSRSPDEFVEYVRTYRSEKIGDVRYANPAVVWYIRLSIEGFWDQYVSKIRRDIAAGVPEATFDAVLEIADRFGVRDKIRERVVFAKKTLRFYKGAESGSTLHS
jgi:hypothetical protein